MLITRPINATTINLINHSVKALQASIVKLLEVTPSEKALLDTKKSPKTDPLIKSLLDNPKVLLAAKLKDLYDDGRLQLFDDLKNFNPIRTEGSVDLADIGAELGIKNDNDGNGDNEKEENKQKKSKTSKKSKKQQLQSLTSDAYFEDARFGQKVQEFVMTYSQNFPPPLPEINSTQILTKVFMHKSMLPSDATKVERITSSNERLEFLGDAFLNTLITAILYEWFSNLDEGTMTTLRSKLVCNARLVEWSNLYQFPAKLSTHNIDEEYVLKSKNKIYADVFEAYIGGLVLEAGANFNPIKNWLRVLAVPVVKKFLDSDEFQQSNFQNSQTFIESLKSNNYVNELYSLIGYGLNPPVYQKIKEGNAHIGQEFEFTVSMDGEELGRGLGRNMKEAKKMAAKDALQNHHDLVEKYYLKRMAVPREVSQASYRQKEDETDTNLAVPVANLEDKVGGLSRQSTKRPRNLLESDDTKISEEESSAGSNEEKSSKKKEKSPKLEGVVVVPPEINSKIDKSARNRVDTLFFKKVLQIPTYRSVSEGPGRFKVTLEVKGVDVAYCLAESEEAGILSICMWVESNSKKFFKRLSKRLGKQ